MPANKINNIDKSTLEGTERFIIKTKKELFSTKMET